MKKNLFAALFASVFMFSAAANAAVDAAQAEAFVEKVTREGIEEIINANVSQTVKDQRFEKLFNNALDLNFIGQFVLGRYWRTSTPEQKKGFINAYRELNIKTWSKRFDEFKGKKFVFKGTSPSNSAQPDFRKFSGTDGSGRTGQSRLARQTDRRQIQNRRHHH